MISFEQKGDFAGLSSYLTKVSASARAASLEQYGEEGVRALMAATPSESGKTANSWYYKITYERGRSIISFYNSNIQNGVNIAVILQYGHATRNGGWVEGVDYINPAIKPIFDRIVDSAWKEVIKQ